MKVVCEATDVPNEAQIGGELLVCFALHNDSEFL